MTVVNKQTVFVDIKLSIKFHQDTFYCLVLNFRQKIYRLETMAQHISPDFGKHGSISIPQYSMSNGLAFSICGKKKNLHNRPLIQPYCE